MIGRQSADCRFDSLCSSQYSLAMTINFHQLGKQAWLWWSVSAVVLPVL